MELPAALLIGLSDALDRLDDVEGRDEVHVDPACVSDETENGVFMPFGNVDVKPLGLEPADKMFLLFGGRVSFKYRDHLIFSPSVVLKQNKYKAAPE